jgi:hypothetical protein
MAVALPMPDVAPVMRTILPSISHHHNGFGGGTHSEKHVD